MQREDWLMDSIINCRRRFGQFEFGLLYAHQHAHIQDYTKLLELLPTSSPQVAQTRRLLVALKPRLDAAREKETAEMWKNLKGIGNSILGAFF